MELRLFRKRKFVEITAHYYWSYGHTSLWSDEYPYLINIANCEAIQPQVVDVYGKETYLILFAKSEKETHIPVLVFETQKEMEEEYKKLKYKWS